MKPALRLFSPLEKLRLSDRAERLPEYTGCSALWNEETAFQCAVHGDGAFPVRINAPPGVVPTVYRVGEVPCGLPCYPEPDRHDAEYLSTEPGLFPDVLFPLEDGTLTVGKRATLWVSLFVGPGAPAGPHPVTLSVGGEEARFTLTVVPVSLPEQALTVTQWFHTDCIASLHRVPVYSEAHWALLEKYMRCAAAHGINMLLTPVLTPALDTAVGGERPCTQLTEIEVLPDGGYAFDFSKLERWVRLARSCGIEKFEISHLFSQWGAKCAPNIYASVNGVRRRIFGWDTPSVSPAYTRFLGAFLPALRGELERLGVSSGNVMFHISDEPGEKDLETYRAAKAAAMPYLAGCTVRDALSSFALYESGTVEHPIVSNDHIAPFLARGVPDLWTYTCCGQCVDVSNRFLALPSWRNRILGAQMWLHGVTGFLHWGFNFWYTQYSLAVIDPFTTTDAGGAFPGGDAFSVYPGENGPLPSLRLKVFQSALFDHRALSLLESHIGREKTGALLGEGAQMTFSSYPRGASYILGLRERVDRALAESL